MYSYSVRKNCIDAYHAQKVPGIDSRSTMTLTTSTCLLKINGYINETALSCISPQRDLVNSEWFHITPYLKLKSGLGVLFVSFLTSFKTLKLKKYYKYWFLTWPLGFDEAKSVFSRLNRTLKNIVWVFFFLIPWRNRDLSQVRQHLCFVRRDCGVKKTNSYVFPGEKHEAIITTCSTFFCPLWFVYCN